MVYTLPSQMPDVAAAVKSQTRYMQILDLIINCHTAEVCLDSLNRTTAEVSEWSILQQWGVELAIALLQDLQDTGSSNNNALTRCVCSKCRVMETAEENVCCRKRPYLTIMGWFDTVVLNRDVLSVAIEARSDVFADDPECTPASYRKAASLWYGNMGI